MPMPTSQIIRTSLVQNYGWYPTPESIQQRIIGLNMDREITPQALAEATRSVMANFEEYVVPFREALERRGPREPFRK